MIFIVKPFLKQIGDLYAEDNIGKPVIAIFFFVVNYFILCNRGCGIHALLVDL
jgi:hypothetical protein